MKLIRSGNDVKAYSVAYTDTIEALDRENDDDFRYIEGLKTEEMAKGAAAGVLYAGDYVYAAVFEDTIGFLNDGTYGVKSSKLIEDFYVEEIEMPGEEKQFS